DRVLGAHHPGQGRAPEVAALGAGPVTPISPRLLRGGLVVVDPDSGAVQRVVTLQYNPDSLARGFSLKATPEGGARDAARRFTGPPAQTLTVEVELDATDSLADPDANADAVQLGLAAQLAAIESLVYPTLAAVRDAAALAAAGMLEVAPAPAPLVLF